MPFPFQQIQQLDMGRQQMERNAMLLDAAKRAQAARGPAMQMLYDTMGGQAQPQGAMPPPPQQQPAPQPGAMSPGGGNPMAQGGASMMAPPQPQAQPPSPLKIAPFRPMPAGPTGGGESAQGGGQVPPPPSAAPAQPQAPAAPSGKQFDLKTIIGNLKQAGVPPEKAMDMLETLTPVMSAENKRELEMHKTENAALLAAVRAYQATHLAQTRQQDADTRSTAEARRKEQGDSRIAILKAKAEAAAQGAGNIKNSELVYPKGPDGKADMTQEPLGIRAITKSGKIINLDHEGHPVATLGGITGKDSKSSEVRVKDTVRTNIVKSGVTNSLARLTEIDKLGDVSTSSFFGQHGDNPLTRGAYGAAKGMQSKVQQETDAKWASMIDEAIPVFTGGLRGSDAFRRFLIEQAPGPGDKPETIREKKRLFRQNIEGTSKAFFNKYSNDPQFWGPGVTKDQVGGGGDAATQGEWKVEKVD